MSELNLKIFSFFHKAPTCLTMRLKKRTQRPPWGGKRGHELDKQLIWSRYKPLQHNIRTSSDYYATVCTLNTKENLLCVGCNNGDILMYDSNRYAFSHYFSSKFFATHYLKRFSFQLFWNSHNFVFFVLISLK